MAWFNPFSIKSQTIIRKGSAQASSPVSGSYSLILSGTNDYIFSVSTVTEFVQVRFTGYETNQWQSIVGVKKGGNLLLYVNGVQVNSEIISGIMAYDTSLFLIGTRLQLPSSTFDGKIDEIRLYNRALTVEEINETLSTSEYSINQDFYLFPNPSEDKINVKNLRFSSSEIYFQIFSLTGTIVKKGVLNQEKVIDIIDLSSGIYLMEIFNDEYNIKKKFLKK